MVSAARKSSKLEMEIPDVSSSPRLSLKGSANPIPQALSGRTSGVDPVSISGLLRSPRGGRWDGRIVRRAKSFHLEALEHPPAEKRVGQLLVCLPKFPQRCRDQAGHRSRSSVSVRGASNGRADCPGHEEWSRPMPSTFLWISVSGDQFLGVPFARMARHL